MILTAERNLVHALAYPELGFSVLPVHAIRDDACTCRAGRQCRHPGKHPRTRNGVKAATMDRERIEKWWKRHPEANIAIATGAASGVVAIDIDPRNGGLESMGTLVRRLGQLPPTLEAKTGGGGRHLVFEYPGQHVSNKQGIKPGVDVKGDRGYIVVAPSVHASGGRYQWLRSLDPWSLKPAPLPTRWLGWLNALHARKPNLDSISREACNRSNSLGGPRESDWDSDPSAEPIQGSTIEQAIRETLPTGPGQRNRRVFDLARALQGIFPDANPNDLEGYVRRWYMLALPYIRTKDYQESFHEFAYAWGRVLHPKGTESVDRAFARAVSGEVPNAANGYPYQQQILIALCWELQRSVGKKPFYLAARTIKRLFGVSHVTGARWLEKLQVRGVLQVVSRGSYRDRKASRFWYLADAIKERKGCKV